MWAQEHFCRTDIYKMVCEEQIHIVPVVLGERILRQSCFQLIPVDVSDSVMCLNVNVEE